ncbi:BRO1 domain-containing protein BROX-like protein [Leptotrombidium deliense]|uniref:BRO1 domain-containing protein BROX-like protein n=1 Tax=Leptotrombidium deliense TaxID=299467 RepID=A0A443S9T7_9ACAR|nr:BRO1 domain-containing protein BROX-like protein [Leptotrombidium deliense]
MFMDANNGITTVETVLNSYISLLLGFVKALDDRGGDYSKLRHSLRFKWTQSMLGDTPIVQQDAIFELISICQEYGIWLMKRASAVAGKDEIKMEEAKEVHTCLRKAAGVFSNVIPEIDKLLDKPDPGTDLDSRVMNAYIQQCIAEAEEVTIARAIELKHNPALISGLANEASKTFLAAASCVKALDASKFGKWMRYFQLKSVFYESYAYCYLGENLLSLDKCGEAIKALQEAEKNLQMAQELCKEYEKFKGPGKTAKLDQHLFFRSLSPLVKRIKEKCERENGMIYHQRIPSEAPVLEMKATHGLVAPENFELPSISQRWTPVAYSAFDLSKNLNPKDPANSKAAQKAEGPLPPMNEKDVHQSAKDPKTSSGCLIQ